MNNTELLFNTFDRISGIFKRHSDIRIEIVNTRHIYFLKGYYEYCQKYVNYSNIKCQNFSLLDELDCFLIPKQHHNNNLIECVSIFEILMSAKERYDLRLKSNNPPDMDSLFLSLATSEASAVLRGIGLPSCLEELSMKLDLMGI
jgi:hypothetical protein